MILKNLAIIGVFFNVRLPSPVFQKVGLCRLGGGGVRPLHQHAAEGLVHRGGFRSLAVAGRSMASRRTNEKMLWNQHFGSCWKQKLHQFQKLKEHVGKKETNVGLKKSEQNGSNMYGTHKGPDVSNKRFVILSGTKTGIFQRFQDVPKNPRPASPLVHRWLNG